MAHRCIPSGALILAGLLLTGLPSVQAAQRVLIMPLVGHNVIDSETALVRRVLADEISRSAAFQVIADQDPALRGVTLKPCDDIRCGLDPGAAARADKVVVGRLRSIGREYVLTVKMLDMARRAEDGNASDRFESCNNDDVQPAVEQILVEILLALRAKNKGQLTPAPAEDLSTPGTGRLAVSSAPNGAVIFLDAVESGRTPCTLTVANGPHEIMLSKIGFVDANMPVIVERNAFVPVRLTLAPQCGILKVRSVPAGAEVYINDELKGRTIPNGLYIPNVPAGVIKLKIRLANHETWSCDARIGAKRETVLQAVLKRLR